MSVTALSQKSNALHVLATLFILTTLGFGVYQAVHSSLFYLKNVLVEPLSDGYPLSPDQILRLARVPIGKHNLFDVSLEPVEARLVQNPWVKGVIIGKQFPDTVSLKVIERKPVALLNEPHGRILYIEENGDVFEDQSLVYAKDLPIITGFSENDMLHLKQVNQFISTWFDANKLPQLKLSSINFDEKYGLKAVVLYPLKNLHTSGPNPVPNQQMRTVLELGLNVQEASLIPQERLKKVLEYLQPIHPGVKNLAGGRKENRCKTVSRPINF